MTNINEENLLTYYWKQFEEEIKNRAKFYDSTAKMVITIPFFVNSGAAVALTSFYNTPHNTLPTIQLATISFILGAVLGLLSLIFEFFFAYYSWSDFQRYLKHFNSRATSPEAMLQELVKYYDSYFTRYNNTSATILLRIINGTISIIFCFIGIFFITRYIVKNSYIPLIISGFTILYSSICIYWMKIKLTQNINE